MRTDCKINTRSVKCPNARLIGFGLGVANVGNLIVYKEFHADDSYSTRTARMIGRVSAPQLDPEGDEIKGWLLVLALSDDCTALYERWVNPQWVVEVREVPTTLLRFFAQPTLPPADVLRRKGESGYLSEHYLAKSGLIEVQS